MTFAGMLGGIAFAAAAASAPAIEAEAALAQPADFKAQADTIIEAAYPAEGPGAAAIVTRGGRVIYATGRGLADLEARRPITPATAFRLGSIVKQFTAAVILQLVAQGRISLDDPISRFFPDYPQPGARATIRQLLNHTSGIQDHTKIVGWMGTEQTARPYSTAELVALISGRPAPSEPGQKWEYNNGGYVMLGAIIEKVTGKAWHEAVTERIARPLGLSTIAYSDGAAAPGVAIGYGKADGQYRPARGAHPSVAHAAGGLVGSVADLAKWAQALHHGRVVSSALYQEMLRPARLADGSTRPYGFALRLRELRGRTALVHGGAGRGLDTDSIYIPSEDLFVAVLANSDDMATGTRAVVQRLAALALGEPIPMLQRVDVDMKEIQPLLGTYGAKSGPPRRFLARDGKLFIGRGDEEKEAFPAGRDRFFFGPDELSWVQFVRRPDGAHLLEVHRPDATEVERAVRTGAVPPPVTLAPAVLQSYVGTYATEGPVLVVALDAEGRLTVAPAGQPPLSLRPVSQTEFRIEGGMMRLVFHPEDGEVNRLTLHRGARELHGKRTGR